MKKVKILITGSHFTPAQAVIEELKKNQGLEVVYLGRKYTQEGDRSISVESQVLPKLGVKFIPITTGRLQRLFTIHTITSLLKIPVGFLQAFYLLLKEQPNVVLSFGGYAAVPTVISAWLLSIPIIIHEQTLVSGLANTISSWFADKIAISFSENKSFDENRVVLTGNPLRKEVINVDQKYNDTVFCDIINLAKKNKLPLIVVTGGNQGSHVLNQVVGTCLKDLTKVACIIHQTGDSRFKDYENLTREKHSLKYPERYVVEKWIDGSSWGWILRNSDLAVSRAGINTLLELAYFGLPALVIPIPYLYKNEQMVNAKFFEKLGLAQVLAQEQLNTITLPKSIKKMVNDLPALKNKAGRLKNIIIPDAAKRLALETLILVEKQK